MYKVEWNTGDEYWDDNPYVEYYNNFEDVIKDLELNKAQIEEFEIEGLLFDEEGVCWRIEKI